MCMCMCFGGRGRERLTAGTHVHARRKLKRVHPRLSPFEAWDGKHKPPPLFVEFETKSEYACTYLCVSFGPAARAQHFIFI